MRRRDQLLRVGPASLLEPGGERVLALEYAVADAEGPGSVLQVASPLGASVSYRHGCLLSI